MWIAVQRQIKSVRKQDSTRLKAPRPRGSATALDIMLAVGETDQDGGIRCAVGLARIVLKLPRWVVGHALDG